MLAKSFGFLKQSNSSIVEVLRNDSEVLARIQAEFHTMLGARVQEGQRPINITCFYEELPLPGVGEVRKTALESIWLIIIFIPSYKISL